MDPTAAPNPKRCISQYIIKVSLVPVLYSAVQSTVKVLYNYWYCTEYFTITDTAQVQFRTGTVHYRFSAVKVQCSKGSVQ